VEYSAATEFLRDKGDAMTSIATVSKIIEGFETVFGLKLLTTVHPWNERKSQFPDRAIEKAIEKQNESNLIALAE
jgi:hypothetical protein